MNIVLKSLPNISTHADFFSGWSSTFFVNGLTGINAKNLSCMIIADFAYDGGLAF